MNTIQLLMQGIATCMDPTLLFLCVTGCFFGMSVGALPGMAAGVALAILLPLIFGRDPLSALILLSGIYYGASFGGAISSITLNIPGTPTSVVTCIDGYPMYQQGKGGKALGIAMFSSFIGGTIGVIGLTMLATILARIALRFGPQEYFSIYVFTFFCIVCIGGKGVVKGAISLFLGLLVSMIGQAPSLYSARLDFGILYLWEGVNFLPVAIGFFGLSEILISITHDVVKIEKKEKMKLREILPTFKEVIFCLPTILRTSACSFFIGVLPGIGGSVSGWLAYKIEEQFGSDRANLGKGSMRGVAAAESSNSSCVTGDFVPMFALGIPGSGGTAILLGALIMVGLTPGPGLFVRNPTFVWGVIGSLFVASVVLLVMGILLIPFFLWLLRVSQNALPIVVAVLCVVGTFSSKNSLFDVVLMLAFCVIGIFFKSLKMPLAPLIVSIILGNDTETAFMQSMQIFKGDYAGFLDRPICIVFFVLSLALISIPAAQWIKKANKEKAAAGAV